MLLCAVYPQEKGTLVIHKDGSEEETESYTVSPGNQRENGSVSEEEHITIVDHQHPQRANRHITVQHFMRKDEREAAGLLPGKHKRSVPLANRAGESAVKSTERGGAKKAGDHPLSGTSNEEAMAVIRGEEHNEPVSDKHKEGGISDMEIDSATEAAEHKAIADAKSNCAGCAEPKKVSDPDVTGAAAAAVRLLNDEKTREGPKVNPALWKQASGQRGGYVSLGKVPRKELSDMNARRSEPCLGAACAGALGTESGGRWDSLLPHHPA